MQSRNIAASKYEALEKELIQYANPQIGTANRPFSNTTYRWYSIG
mgnify:CR=1 FL=1